MRAEHIPVLVRTLDPMTLAQVVAEMRHYASQIDGLSGRIGIRMWIEEMALALEATSLHHDQLVDHIIRRKGHLHDDDEAECVELWRRLNATREG